MRSQPSPIPNARRFLLLTINVVCDELGYNAYKCDEVAVVHALLWCPGEGDGYVKGKSVYAL